MSTRCQVRLLDTWVERDTGEIVSKMGALLYHHSDGYPEFMVQKLDKFLPEAFAVLKAGGHPYWWDSERVAAVLIMLSIEDCRNPLRPFSTLRVDNYESGKPDQPYRPNSGIPVFQPCIELHGDIEYIYNVTLKKQGEYILEAGYADGTPLKLRANGAWTPVRRRKLQLEPLVTYKKPLRRLEVAAI